MSSVFAPSPTAVLARALARYGNGEPRGNIFCDLVLESVRAAGNLATVLDIGCGHGFDNDPDLQAAIAKNASQFIGIEPAHDVPLPAYFTEIHRCQLESAVLAPESVDVAYSAFVLEHVEHPQEFWQRIYNCLRPGGVFWGFTVDARHPFALASWLLGNMRLKDRYLTWLSGERGEDRYENYAVFYRANTPRQIRRRAAGFSRADFRTLNRIGQLDFYFPRQLRKAVHCLQWCSMRSRLPGANLIVRLEK